MDTHILPRWWGWGWVDGVCVLVGGEGEPLKGGHIGE